MSKEQLIKELSQVKHESLFADVVRENPEQSISMIKEQAKDHRLKLCEIIGEKLVIIIENIES
jgi:hypothetical protein